MTYINTTTHDTPHTPHTPNTSLAHMPRAPRLALAMLALVSLQVSAHPMMASNAAFETGFLHPWTGLDHVMAMLLVGVWCALTYKRAWALPMLFSISLAIGLVATSTSLQALYIEPMVAGSVLMLGMLVRGTNRLPSWAGLALLSVFGLLHGAAHGIALAPANHLPVLLGTLLGSASLQLVGYWLGRSLRGHHTLQSALGWSGALVGAALLGAMA